MLYDARKKGLIMNGTRMQNKFSLLLRTSLLFIILVMPGCTPDKSTLLDHETQQNMSPDQVLHNLIAGNKRFISNTPLHRSNLQIKGAKASEVGQFPKAVILACMDSRSIPEIIFDVSVGDIFTLRVAGNIVTEAMIGSMEYGTKYAGAKLIVVLGHTQCGAVQAACKGVKAGNLPYVINPIVPAVDTIASRSTSKNCDEDSFVTQIALQNVHNMMQLIIQKSPVIKELIASKEVAIVGALHDLASGVVKFEFTEGLHSS